MLGYASKTDTVAPVPNNTPSVTTQEGQPVHLPEARCIFRFDVEVAGSGEGSIKSSDGSDISSIPAAVGSYFFYKNRAQGLEVTPGAGQVVTAFYR